jgi:hypothetical protein
VLNNNNQQLESLFVDLSPAGLVFDNAAGDASANGSGPGLAFFSSPAMTSVLSGIIFDELFTGLTVGNIGIGDSFFAIDTDIMNVSAPATASILMLSLLGLVMTSRRKHS